MSEPIAPPLVVEGSKSTAEEAPDGTWTIRGLPFFAEHMGCSESTGRPVPVDRAWLTKCVERQQSEYAANRYLPRLHVNHHDFGDGEVRPAGFFLPTHVAPAAVRGGKVLAIYGDAVGIPPDVYADIRAGKYPYLSCEASLDSGHLETCALLPTRPPRMKFTPITIGDEKPASKSVRSNFSRKREAVVAYASSPGGESRVLTRVPTIMTDDEKKAADAAEAAKKTPTTPNAEPPAAPPAAPAAPAPVAAPVNPMAGLEAKVDTILAILAKLTAPDTDDAPGQPPEVKGTASTAYAERLGTMQGTVDALKARLDAKDAEATKAVELATLEGRLTKYGVKYVEQVRKTYAADGKGAATAYADAIVATVPPSPGRSTLDDAAPGGESALTLSPETLTKYGQKGPDELAVVAKHAREFQRLGGVAGLRMTELTFIESQLPWQRK